MEIYLFRCGMLRILPLSCQLLSNMHAEQTAEKV